MLLARVLVVILLGLDWLGDPQMGGSAFSQPLSSQLSVAPADGSRWTPGAVRAGKLHLLFEPPGVFVPADAARRLRARLQFDREIPARSLVYRLMSLRR